MIKKLIDKIYEKIDKRIPFVKVRVKILQEIINKKKNKLYLEIGVKDGNTFLQIKTPYKFAVDPFFNISKRRKLAMYFRNPYNLFNKYYKMTSDDFFKKPPKIIKKKLIDIAFIDGLHTYEQSLRDVLNCLQFLNNEGVIIMHDCNPPTIEMESPSWYGNVWKTIYHLRNTQNELNVFVLDCDNGLGFIKREEKKNSEIISTENIKNMTFNDLNNKREQILNLKRPKYFLEFIKTIK